MIEDFNDSFYQTVLRYCEGDIEKADYFINCNVNEYYYRLYEKGKWVSWHNKQIKDATQNK